MTDPLDDAITSFYDAAIGAVGWLEALRSLAALFNVAHARYALATAGASEGFCTNVDPALMAVFQERHAGRHDLITRVTDAAPGTVMTDRTVMAKPDFLRTPFYNEFLKPQGLHGLLNLRAARGWGGAVVDVCVVSDQRRGEFEANDMALLGRLAPHLRRAVAINQRLVDAKAAGEAFESTLDRVVQPVLLVDGAARVRGANRAAEAMLSAASELAVDPGHEGALRGPNHAETAKLRRAIAAAAPLAGEGASGRLQLRRAPPASPLDVLILPIRSSAAEKIGLSLARFTLLVVTDPSLNPAVRAPAPALDTLATLFGLTPAESGVALQVVNGGTLRDVSAALGISYATARTHLLRIFNKTGVHRQAELVSLISRLTG